MKNVLGIGLIVLSLGLSATGCSPKPDYRLLIDHEFYDFGLASEGIEIEFDFVLKNSGRQVIQIEDVRPSCSCVVIGDWDKEILPGKKGRIPIVFRTHGYRGEITRFVIVTTNLPENNGQLQVQIRGTVGEPVDIYPKSIPLGEVGPASESLSGSFTITNNTGAPLKILEVILPDEQTRYSLELIRENVEYKLNFSLAPPFEGEGLTERQITLKTNYKKQPEYQLTFSYFVMPPISVFPPNIIFTREKSTDIPFEWIINIQSNIPEPIRVLELSLRGTDRISYELKELGPGRYFQILVTIPGDFTFPDTEIKFSFLVENDPSKKLYEIPIEPHVPVRN